MSEVIRWMGLLGGSSVAVWILAGWVHPVPFAASAAAVITVFCVYGVTALLTRRNQFLTGSSLPVGLVAGTFVGLRVSGAGFSVPMVLGAFVVLLAGVLAGAAASLLLPTSDSVLQWLEDQRVPFLHRRLQRRRRRD